MKIPTETLQKTLFENPYTTFDLTTCVYKFTHYFPFENMFMPLECTKKFKCAQNASFAQNLWVFQVIGLLFPMHNYFDHKLLV